MLVCIDGCPVRCAKKCLEAEGLAPSVHFVVSEEIVVEKGFRRPTEDEVVAILNVADERMSK